MNHTRPKPLIITALTAETTCAGVHICVNTKYPKRLVAYMLSSQPTYQRQQVSRPSQRVPHRLDWVAGVMRLWFLPESDEANPACFDLIWPQGQTRVYIAFDAVDQSRRAMSRLPIFALERNYRTRILEPWTPVLRRYNPWGISFGDSAFVTPSFGKVEINSAGVLQTVTLSLSFQLAAPGQSFPLCSTWLAIESILTSGVANDQWAAEIAAFGPSNISTTIQVAPFVGPDADIGRWIWRRPKLPYLFTMLSAVMQTSEPNRFGRTEPPVSSGSFTALNLRIFGPLNFPFTPPYRMTLGRIAIGTLDTEVTIIRSKWAHSEPFNPFASSASPP